MSGREVGAKMNSNREKKSDRRQRRGCVPLFVGFMRSRSWCGNCVMPPPSPRKKILLLEHYCLYLVSYFFKKN